MRTVRTHTDAWTYYEFGARSFYDQVLAVVLDNLRETIHSPMGIANLGKQSTSGSFPVIPVLGAQDQLLPEPVDPQSVGSVTSFIGRVELQKYPIAIADTVENRETLAKLIDCLGRRITLDLTLALLRGQAVNRGVPSLAELAQAINAPGPDDQALPTGRP